MEQKENKEKGTIFKNPEILAKNLNSTIMQVIVFVLVFHIYKEWDLEQIKNLNVSFLFFLKNFIACHYQIILLNKYRNNFKTLNKTNNLLQEECNSLYLRIKEKVLNDDKTQEQIFNELEKEYQDILKEDTNKLISEFIAQTLINHSTNNSFQEKVDDSKESPKNE
ncbi:MAG: hypothetical protein Q2306_01545 [Phytoplasma sp.]|uniref:hypothetical protein n=1 Tax=Phytoplasma sp. TaxID=2155 RepID=UPI002B411432|nr:hypothetical protein [Phytoplasma sp.]WRH06572.1 MAG: hypothetical protein Q2306_01545 [Phytoplasma sp.]